MGLFDTTTHAQHKRELRESKGEVLFGELIRGLSGFGWRPYRIVAGVDRQAVGFKVPEDPSISAYSLLIDRTGGSGMVAPASASRTVMGLIAESAGRVGDLDALSARWRQERAGVFTLPVAGEVRIDHQLNRVVARTHELIELDLYFSGNGVDLSALVDWTHNRLLELGAQVLAAGQG